MLSLINQPTEYALSVLVELALEASPVPVQASDLARRAGIPLASAHQALVRLRRQGLVRSGRGPAGGYALARDAERIAVGEVVEAFSSAAPGDRFDAEEPSRRAVQLWAMETGQAIGGLLASETIGGLAKRARRLSDVMALMPGL